MNNFPNVALRARVVACAAISLIGAPSLAFAQGSGGGNGIIAPFVTWFQSNFATGIVVLAVAFCGLAFMTGVRNWMLFVSVAVGALVLANATTIAGILYTGTMN
jgi:type IV secretory pathway VirB2 component (pilin)